MIPKSGYRFSDKIMLQHKLERDDDSKKSHHALDFSESGRTYVMKLTAVAFGCLILAGCTGAPFSSTTPTATWTGKRPIGDTVACVQSALDENARLTGPLTQNAKHRIETVEPERVYQIIPDMLGGKELYFAHVRSEGPGRTTIELFIPAMQYNAPLRDAVAKCA